MDNETFEAKIIQLVEGVAELSSKVDSMQKDIDSIKKYTETITDHSTKLVELEAQINQLGNQGQRIDQKFLKVEDKQNELLQRINTLEKADGEKAKGVMKSVGNYILSTVIGFVAAAIMFYINNR